MNKQIVFFLTVFCFFLKAKAQNNEGIVIYSKEYKRNIFKHKSKGTSLQMFNQFKKHEEKIKEATKKINFELIFKKDRALFQVQNFLEIEGEKFLKAAIGPEASGKFYYHNQNVTWNVNAFGEDFIVSQEKPKWILKSDTKKIGKYECRKAIIRVSSKTKIKSNNKTITAWYCPQLNIPYGPIGYSGLPGLILELDMGNEIRYYATKINLHPKKKITIKSPSKGKKVTEKEFKEIGVSVMKRFKRNKNRRR